MLSTIPNDSRLSRFDTIRGLLIIIMALDHASALLGDGTHAVLEMWGGPDPLDRPLHLFLTRSLAHFCAPGFFLLMGVGMSLLACSRLKKNSWTIARIRRHFVLRGLLLIALQLLVENVAWALGFDLAGDGGGGLVLYFGVLYALGMSFIVGSMLVSFPVKGRLAGAFVCLVSTWALLPSPEAWGAAAGPLLRLLAVPGGGDALLCYYPALPWLGVALCGMALGKAVSFDEQAVMKRLPLIGLGLIAFFLVNRLMLGDIGGGRDLPIDELHHLLALVKYPPSLSYLSWTLGVNLLLISLFHKLAGRPWLTPLQTFGRTPLFFYIAHLYVFVLFQKTIVQQRVDLPMVFVCWLAGAALLYPACRAYGAMKAGSKPGSLWRFL